jgi:hypothetical protein
MVSLSKLLFHLARAQAYGNGSRKKSIHGYA